MSNIVRIFFRMEVSQQLHYVPAFSVLLCTIQGGVFPQMKCLLEISENIIPTGTYIKPFFDFIFKLLNDPRGINTVCKVNTGFTCEECQRASLTLQEVGPLISLPYAGGNDSIVSLVNRWVANCHREGCGIHHSLSKSKHFLNNTDVIFFI